MHVTSTFFLPMTIQRRKIKDGEEVSVSETPITNPWLRLLLGQNGWKLIVIGLIATQHPLGRGVLASVGFEFQDTKKIAAAAENATTTKSELSQVTEALKDVKTDLTSVKANIAITNSKVDSLEQTFRGFQVDFSKWKPADKKIE